MNIEQMGGKLPHLPEFSSEFRPRWPGDVGGYTVEQMREYAALVRNQALDEAAQEASQMLTAGRSPLVNLVAKAIRALKDQK